jgi:ABC-type phosphate transport system permease subunit
MTVSSTNHVFRKFKSLAMNTLCIACAVLVILPLAVILFYLVQKGASSLNWAFFTGVPQSPGSRGGGMGNAIVGTLELLLLASAIGVPVGVLGGVYLSEYGGERINGWIRFWADVLNGVPSIVWGMVAWALIVVPLTAPFRGTVKSINAAESTITVQSPGGDTQQFTLDPKTKLNFNGKTQLDSLPQGADVMVWYQREGDGSTVTHSISATGLWNLFVAKAIGLHNAFSGFSALAGGLALGFIMVPLVLRTTEEVLVLVPRSYREAALALGLPQWKTIARIVLPTAMRGIITGVLLAMGRVAGETAPLLFTAFGNSNWNHHLSEPIAALPLQIFSYAIAPYDDWNRQAWAGALVLVMLTFLLSTGVRLFSRSRFQKNT